MQAGICWYLVLIGVLPMSLMAQQSFEQDTIKTSAGELVITFIGHGSLMFSCKDLVIHIDPSAREADYSTLPKADIILVTHEHRDHFDPQVLQMLSKENTQIILTEKCSKEFNRRMIMKNGEIKKLRHISIEAIPAYNIVSKRPNGQPYHPKGEGNGYIITIGGTRVYIAGDTENIPEMKALTAIDIAFLPMNLPYTMSPAMVAEAAKTFKPTILYPYHYGDTDPQQLVELLKSEKAIEVRIRALR